MPGVLTPPPKVALTSRWRDGSDRPGRDARTGSCRSPTSRRRRPRPSQAHEVAVYATLARGVERLGLPSFLWQSFNLDDVI